MPVLRAVSSDDWEAWRALRLAALEEAPHAFSSQLADWQGAGDHESRWRGRLEDRALNLIASVDGVDVGQASGVSADAEGAAELVSMWVAPAARGRGVALTLVTAVVAWAVGEGARALQLEVRRENAPAISLYRRCGFAFTGRSPTDPAEIVMSLPLAGPGWLRPPPPPPSPEAHDGP